MKRIKKNVGQSVLEFALIFPILFLMITGLFDLGRAVFAYTTFNNAVREGTRYASVQPKNTTGATDTAIESKIRNYFYQIKDFNDNSVIHIARIDMDTDPKIQITITYSFNPITPGIKQIIGHGSSIAIVAESTMRLSPFAYADSTAIP
jgi:Flp pilus assembly protein TadG